MPFRSDQQRKAMHAAAEGRGNIGIPQAVARKFVRDSKAEGGEVSEPTDAWGNRIEDDYHARERPGPSLARRLYNDLVVPVGGSTDKPMWEDFKDRVKGDYEYFTGKRKAADKKADGGSLGGPPDPRMHNPQFRESYERYAGMDPNQLQQLAVQLPFSSPQGQIVRDLVQEKMMSPQASDGPEVDLVTEETYAKGGDVQKPWYNRKRKGDLVVDRSGALQSTIPGRTDHIPMTAPTGSYVVPADVVSGLGEGNSLAGARIMAELLKNGPWGVDIATPRGGGRGIPAAPRGQQMPEEGMARGGKKEKPVPILAAGGEYVISPQDVRRIGGGNERRGHQVLDKWVVGERSKIVKKMKSLPGPKR